VAVLQNGPRRDRHLIPALLAAPATPPDRPNIGPSTPGTYPAARPTQSCEVFGAGLFAAKAPLQLKQCPRKILDHDPKHYRLGPVASSTYPYPMMRRTRYACSAAHCPEGRSPAEAGAACALTVDDVAQTDSVVQLLPKRLRFVPDTPMQSN